MEKFIKGVPKKEYYRAYWREYVKKNPEKMRKKWKSDSEKRRRKLGMKKRISLSPQEKIERKREKDRIYARTKRKEKRKIRYWSDIKFRIDNVIGSSISSCLNGNKNFRKWEHLVGYSVEDLIKHLESNFDPWMSWDNYGEWQIDHIKPKSWFDYTKPEDNEFKECWALNNLQPLKKEHNIKKGNKYIGGCVPLKRIKGRND